jgi:DNA-binding NarL/FixJ family response regulator
LCNLGIALTKKQIKEVKNVDGIIFEAGIREPALIISDDGTPKNNVGTAWAKLHRQYGVALSKLSIIPLPGVDKNDVLDVLAAKAMGYLVEDGDDREEA